MKNKTIYHLSVIIEKDRSGYVAICPDLQGCYTQGGTYEEVLANIKDAIQLHIEDRLLAGEGQIDKKSGLRSENLSQATSKRLI